MRTLNKILKLVNLTWVIRNQLDLSTGLACLVKRNKKLLIFGYKTPNEKILLETEYK